MTDHVVNLKDNNEARASYLILKRHLYVNQRMLGHRIEDKQIASFNEQKFGFINGVDNVNWPPYRDSWTPPEGQFASLDFFTKKCRHDIYKLKFNRNTKFSNLSSEE